MQGQNLTGPSPVPSPPNQIVSQGAPQKLSGEIPIQASAAPIKQSEKLPSPNLEQITNVNFEVQNDPSPNNKHVASRNASGFAPLSLSVPKKDKDVESTQTSVAPIYFTQPQNKPPPSHAPLPSQEKKVIPIVDPATNKNILEDMALSSKGNDNTTTPIQSRDFSTANTPALGDAVQRSGPNNHLATEFARSVINRMAMGDETDEQPEPIVNPIREELNEDEIIVRKMREILDTLTPVNFEKLAVQIMKFKIVEFGTFDSVIDLIFEKAIGEQVFSKTYADLCKGLSHFSFKVKTEKEEEGGELRFKNILINKCKEEFEKDNSEDLQKEERLKEIAEATDPVCKTELTAKLEWDERRLIRRSVGNLRFIGELYKNRMLTSSIMMRITRLLLSKQNEESLECLCTFLSTIGYMQEQASQKAQAEISEVFTTLRKIVDERKTSSHVRFMIMDLIDERDTQWDRRRENAKPKIKAEEHEEIRKDIMRRSNPMGNLAPGGMNATHRQAERKLKTTENAWKPSVRKELNEDESIVRKMRGILNKLMPQNFEKLTVQIMKFKIVEFGTFDSVIGLIFEKAVDDQAFSKTYADLCKVLSYLSIKVKTEKEKKGEEARFRNLLINKCQQEFEKDNSKDLQKEERLKKIAEATDPEYKAELKALLEYDERRLRKRSVGNIRFIGELYKNRMLTSSIMMRITRLLLSKQDEESLECLCTFLSTIGYMLEPQSQASQKAQAEINEVFTALRKIVDERKTSNRVRFMIMDLIDQRKNQWVRRREDAKPKKKAEVHEEIRKEELEQQYLLASAPKRDDRERKRSRDTRGLMTDDNGWNTVICSRRTMFDSSRLKSQTFNRNSDNDPPVFSAKFSNWATGNTGRNKNHEEESSRPFIDRFAPLELTPMMDMRRSNPMGKLAPGGMNTTHRQGNSSESKSMPPPSEKGIIHYSKMSSASSGDRSKSNSRSSSRQSSRDNSMIEEATTTYRDIQKPVQQKPPLDRNMVEKYTNDLLEEYYDINEAVLCFQEKFKHHVDILKFVEISFLKVFVKTVEKRAKIGSLYNHLIKHKYMSISQFAEGLKPVLEMLSKYVIDYPQVFSYVGGILCRLLVDNVASLENILTILEPCEKKMDVFAKVMKEASFVFMEASVIELWESSKINLKALLPEDLSVNEYLTKHEIQFISEASSSECSVVAGEDMPIDAKLIRIELCKLFKSKVPNKEIFDWIEKHIGNKTNTKTFIRALTTALIESLLLRTDGNSYVTIEDFSDKLKEKGKFIRKYVNNNQDLQLACIYAMQAVCVECQHPPGLLEKSFNALYDIEVLIEDSFYQWEKSDDPEGQFGKGVCLTSVKKFLDWLRDEPDPTDSGMDDV